MLNKIKKFFHGSFASDESKFCLKVAALVTGLPVLGLMYIGFILWIIININLGLMEAQMQDFSSTFAETYNQFIMKNVWEILIYIFIFCIFLFFAGLYVATLLIRPFKKIADYCVRSMEGGTGNYHPDLFSDLKHLTTFSELFFDHIRDCTQKQKLTPMEMPKYYAGIHRPVFEKVFFMHFFLFILIIGLLACTGLYNLFINTYESMVDFSFYYLKKDQLMGKFFSKQTIMIDSLLWVSLSILVIQYAFFALYLYRKVSHGAFGIFSTMRAFSKGDYSARVHLIGHSYLRTYTRPLNKFLDQIVRKMNNPR